MFAAESPGKREQALELSEHQVLLVPALGAFVPARERRELEGRLLKGADEFEQPHPDRRPRTGSMCPFRPTICTFVMATSIGSRLARAGGRQDERQRGLDDCGVAGPCVCQHAGRALFSLAGDLGRIVLRRVEHDAPSLGGRSGGVVPGGGEQARCVCASLFETRL
jgi:hypothetical protein